LKNTWEIRGCHIRNLKLSPKKRAMIGIQSKLLTREARLKEQKKSQEFNLEALLIILNQKKIIPLQVLELNLRLVSKI